MVSVVCSLNQYRQFCADGRNFNQGFSFLYFVAVNSLFFRICYRFPKVFIFTLKTKNFIFYLRCELELPKYRCRISLAATTTQTLSDLRSMQIPLKNHSLRRSIDRNNLRPSFLFLFIFSFLFLSTVAFQETFHFSVPQQTLNFLFQSPKVQKPKNTNFAFFTTEP